MKRFAEKTVVITGAASGIGAATARRFASEGAAVVLVDVDEAAGIRGQTALSDEGATARFVRCDVAEEADWQAVITETAKLGRVDVLHSNAYVHRAGLPTALDPAAWDQVMAVNVKGLYFGVRAFLPDLRARHGSIITTSSVHALFGLPGYTAYAASKGALTAVTRQLAVELAPDVRVNCVLPGPIRTAAFEPDEDMSETARATALNRLGAPEEVAAAVAFLASDDASFITGASLTVDGGWSVKKESL